MLAIAFGSISFMTYAISFWVPPYVDPHLLRRPGAAPAAIIGGMTAAKEEVASIIGWARRRSPRRPA